MPPHYISLMIDGGHAISKRIDKVKNRIVFQMALIESQKKSARFMTAEVTFFASLDIF